MFRNWHFDFWYIWGFSVLFSLAICRDNFLQRFLASIFFFSIRRIRKKNLSRFFNPFSYYLWVISKIKIIRPPPLFFSKPNSQKKSVNSFFTFSSRTEYIRRESIVFKVLHSKNKFNPYCVIFLLLFPTYWWGSKFRTVKFEIGWYFDFENWRTCKCRTAELIRITTIENEIYIKGQI